MLSILKKSRRKSSKFNFYWSNNPPLTSSLSLRHLCWIDFYGFWASHHDSQFPCRWLKNVSVDNTPPPRLCSASTQLYEEESFVARKEMKIISLGMINVFSSKFHLERCCGRQSWFGRPEALEPGVLTDCDRVWCGEPYLKKECIEYRKFKKDGISFPTSSRTISALW